MMIGCENDTVKFIISTEALCCALLYTTCLPYMAFGRQCCLPMLKPASYSDATLSPCSDSCQWCTLMCTHQSTSVISAQCQYLALKEQMMHTAAQHCQSKHQWNQSSKLGSCYRSVCNIVHELYALCCTQTVSLLLCMYLQGTNSHHCCLRMIVILLLMQCSQQCRNTRWCSSNQSPTTV